MISGTTKLIAHLGYPTAGFKAPLIYNPWFETRGIDAAVIPMGVKTDDYPAALKAIFSVTNVHGALVTMPQSRSAMSGLAPPRHWPGDCGNTFRRSPSATANPTHRTSNSS